MLMLQQVQEDHVLDVGAAARLRPKQPSPRRGSQVDPSSPMQPAKTTTDLDATPFVAES